MKEIQPVRGRKFAQVVEGARRVFLRDGFEGASVDDIAHEAGVSKATLYTYFPDKRLMFAEVFRSELRRAALDATGRIDPAQSAEEMLMTLARILVAHVTSPEWARIYRVSVGEAARFPALAREYYEMGPVAVRDVLAAHLGDAVSRGLLVIDDIPLAAEQFLQLCEASVQPRKIFLGGAAVDDDLRERVVRGAVRLMMAAYGAHPQDRMMDGCPAGHRLLAS